MTTTEPPPAADGVVTPPAVPPAADGVVTPPAVPPAASGSAEQADDDELVSAEGFRLDTSIAFESDIWFFRTIAIALGLAIVTAVGGSIWLASIGEEVPEAIIAIGSASVGALAGVLTVRRQVS